MIFGGISHVFLLLFSTIIPFPEFGTISLMNLLKRQDSGAYDFDFYYFQLNYPYQH
ncbi:uncharacterized protein P174DRAFT_443070 [Aspergillus novofumigatus IBT 16806]|uniref:Uncharacterized protein n=1 Tax=Aspergillus novofumigatus (strain IBT 16806) TaxID=1392255 RepID=A0A2I1C6H1_ASPN1|nr:uncharacterized protein P174DRAFT_443070 [Aspergillus novofumigatus IBT 16806]PKX93196.1 hypothetical protein P174DRAFT_443070 [Aspergillus novofumigatus IBT 16806]